MILATVPLPRDLEIPAGILERPATTDVQTLRRSRLHGVPGRGAPPLGADLWLWCGLATPHHDRHLGPILLVTLAVQSEHGIGDALAREPEAPYARGTLAVFDPATVHWLVPSQTELADDAGRIRLPLWVGLQWEMPRDEAPARVRTLVERLGGTWASTMDRRYAHWRPDGRGLDPV